jgi:hypothetical protein
MKSRVVSRRRLIFGGTLVLIIAAGAVSGFFAQQQAFDAETEYVAEELRDEPCLSNWGVNEGTASKRVSRNVSDQHAQSLIMAAVVRYRIDRMTACGRPGK